jgi:O-succinylbenzoic acid--CoA ligase
MLSAANLAASASQVNAQLSLQADDCWLNCLPLSHVAGLSIPYRCSEAGATMLLHQRFNTDQVWRDLEEQRVTHISLVPAMLGRLLDAAQGRMAPNLLRVALIGGGPLDPALAKRAHAAGWPLVVCYGMTETGSMCVLDRTAQAGLKPGRVGEPMAGFRISLADEGSGEIRVSGDAVMAGYVNPRLEPGEGLEDGCFKTGDLGYWDHQGQLCVTGRADDLMNSGGLRLHPGEVERLLKPCPGLISAAVSSRPDPLWGDRLVVLYEGVVSETWLDAWVRLNLPSGLRPREFIKLDSLPKNRMGKLDRGALKQHIGSMRCVMPQAAPWVSGVQGST